MKRKACIFTLLIFLSSIAGADISQDAQQASKLATSINALIQGQANASAETKKISTQLQTKTQALQIAVQTHGIHKQSKDELWQVFRNQRDLDAQLSVSPLRKNKDLTGKISQLQSKLNSIKQALE